jgi:hypothetical protein
MKGTGTTVAQQNWVLTCVPVQVKLMHYVARVSAMDGHYTCNIFSSCSGSKNTDGVAVACMCHNMSLLINTIHHCHLAHICISYYLHTQPFLIQFIVAVLAVFTLLACILQVSLAMSTLTSCLAYTVRLQHACVRPCTLQTVTSHHHNY